MRSSRGGCRRQRDSDASHPCQRSPVENGRVTSFRSPILTLSSMGCTQSAPGQIGRHALVRRFLTVLYNEHFRTLAHQRVTDARRHGRSGDSVGGGHRVGDHRHRVPGCSGGTRPRNDDRHAAGFMRESGRRLPGRRCSRPTAETVLAPVPAYRRCDSGWAQEWVWFSSIFEPSSPLCLSKIESPFAAWSACQMSAPSTVR